MRRTRHALMMLLSGASVACTAAARTVPDGLRNDASLAQPTPEERRQMRDSSAAQEVADEVGPRVTVTADFINESGSRRVETTFHMYDDAYVIVGHLDAAGRLKIVFPSTTGDDGFVRGDKIYHVPSFFAGFTDEYAWRHNDYYYRAHSTASRRDSYDAGLGYVFVVASWRPMRLDRIADGDHWQTYNVSDVSYMNDPREAIEELGSLIAGDNREAYTIEYARYSTTNYGMYSMADFDAVNSDCYGYRSSLGFGATSLFFSPFYFLPTYGFGFASMGCDGFEFGYPYSYAYGYPYGYPYGGVYGYPVGSNPPPIVGKPGRRGPIATPLGIPQLHLPRVPGGPGSLAFHDPGTKVIPSAPGGGTSLYRRPGLITEDGGVRTPGEVQPSGSTFGLTSNRPTIQQMIGAHHIEDEAARNGMSFGGREPNSPAWANHGGSSGYSAPRGGEAHSNLNGGSNGSSRQGGRGFTPTYSAPPRTHGGEGGARMAPSHAAPSHAEPSHSAPAHSEPARSSPPSSSSGSKKP
jgi:hypothetical protein